MDLSIQGVMPRSSRKACKALEIKSVPWGIKATRTSRMITMLEYTIRACSIIFLGVAALMATTIVAGVLLVDNLTSSYGIYRETLAVLTIGVSGAFLLYFDRAGIRRQVQVDHENREVRIGHVRLGGQFVKSNKIPQEMIASAVLVRMSQPKCGASVSLNLHGMSSRLSVISGKEKELEVVLGAVRQMTNRQSLRIRPDDRFSMKAA